MAEPLADQILRKIGEVCSLYHRLILMVGPAGSGKTSALQEVSASTSAPLINVNLKLSRRMMDLTERQRALQLPRLLQDICASSVERHASEVLLLDNLEILFDVKLKHDPLRLLQGMSRNQTIVAAWPGQVVDSGTGCGREDARRTTLDAGRYLTYAAPNHPEYRRYPIRDLIIVEVSSVEHHASEGRL
jgi:hypothetical protein